MSGWKVSTASLIVLGSVVFVMLVIVVLPDVDLLDTAFQRGTAPMAVHTQATSAPSALTLAIAFQLSEHVVGVGQNFHRLFSVTVHSSPNFLPILLGSLRR